MTTQPESDAVAVLEQRIRPEVERVVELVLAAQRREIEELPADEDLQEAMREACRADLNHAFRAFVEGREVPHTITFEASHWARRAAQSKVTLHTVLQMIRVAQRVVWDALCATVDEVVPDRAVRDSLLRSITGALIEGGSRSSLLLAEEYLAERDRLMRTNGQKTLILVQQILADPATDATALGYDVRAGHFAVVASGADAERVVREATPARRLVVQAAPDVIWAWFATQPPDFSSLSAPGVSIGVGRLGTGRDGFAASHEQARAAHALGRAGGRPVTRFDEIALEWLLTRDRTAAERFVADELGLLLGDHTPRAPLIDTLEAYLEAGYNASSMAARMKISVRTASNRVRSIEELLGRTIASRNAELHAAVRLYRQLNADRPQPVASRPL